MNRTAKEWNEEADKISKTATGRSFLLQAAIPELLEACKAIAELAEGQGRRNLLEIAGIARIAIDKAEGK